MNISGIMIDKIFENQNISLHDLEHFATYFNLTRPSTNLSLLNTTIANSNCDHYCAGFIRDLLGSYKSIHGYISLVVSVFLNSHYIQFFAVDFKREKLLKIQHQNQNIESKKTVYQTSTVKQNLLHCYLRRKTQVNIETMY